MPEISKFFGIFIYMYIGDHNPPHFHVWYEGDEATIDIADGRVTGTLSRRALRLVYEWLDLHKGTDGELATVGQQRSCRKD